MHEVSGKIMMCESVENADRKFGSDNEYYPVYVDVDGEMKPALFTRNQLDVALERAAVNPEDCPPEKKDFLESIFGSIFG